MRLLLTGLGFAIGFGLIWRALYNVRAMKEKIYIKLWA